MNGADFFVIQVKIYSYYAQISGFSRISSRMFPSVILLLQKTPKKSYINLHRSQYCVMMISE